MAMNGAPPGFENMRPRPVIRPDARVHLIKQLVRLCPPLAEDTDHGVRRELNQAVTNNGRELPYHSTSFSHTDGAR